MERHCRGLNVCISKGYYSRVSVKLLSLLLLLEGGNSCFCFDDFLSIIIIIIIHSI